MKMVWFLLVAMAPACATSGLSPAQRQKASDCASMCERDRPPPPSSGPLGRSDGAFGDTRSECENRCGL
jgi:hypothetical protein